MKLINRLLSFFQAEIKSIKPDLIDKIGLNTQIKGSVDKSRAPKSKIKIGNDCLILGYISLETDQAEIEIGDNVYIGQGTTIVCSNKITIGSDILISQDCIIQDSDNHNVDFEIRKKDLADWKRNYHDWSTHPSRPIHLSNGCWIGARVIILKGVVIGVKSIVGAGSVVTRSVANNTIVAGNPVKIIKTID